MNKEGYEEKIAREERLHKEYLEDQEYRKRLTWWMNLSDKEQQNELLRNSLKEKNDR